MPIWQLGKVPLIPEVDGFGPVGLVADLEGFVSGEATNALLADHEPGCAELEVVDATRTQLKEERSSQV